MILNIPYSHYYRWGVLLLALRSGCPGFLDFAKNPLFGVGLLPNILLPGHVVASSHRAGRCTPQVQGISRQQEPMNPK